MARSTYVYVVTDDAGIPIGTFTVKHELVSYLHRHPEPWDISVYRMRDNGGAKDYAVQLSVSGLLESE